MTAKVRACTLRKITTLIAALTVTLCAKNVLAYNAVLDTGKIIPNGKYRVLATPQVILTGDEGLNMSARIDAGVNADSNIRGIIGAGKTNFFTGLFYKYVPYPDLESQPAIGVMGGVTYARQDISNVTEDVTTFVVQPLISKDFEFDYGLITPYASIPIGVKFFDGTSEIPIHFALGSEWKPLEFETVSFIAELGLQMNKTYSYISVGVIFEFDDSEGIEIK